MISLMASLVETRTRITSEATRVLDVLMENKARAEYTALQERIAQIEAVKLLLTRRVETFKEGEITRIMELLRDQKDQIPFLMKSRLTARVFDLRFDFIITNASVPWPLTFPPR